MDKIEYRVKPVTRYIVTKHVPGENPITLQIGEYPNGHQADLVADAMVALDTSNRVESFRSRTGLSLGEVISGNRVPAPQE